MPDRARRAPGSGGPTGRLPCRTPLVDNGGVHERRLREWIETLHRHPEDRGAWLGLARATVRHEGPPPDLDASRVGPALLALVREHPRERDLADLLFRLLRARPLEVRRPGEFWEEGDRLVRGEGAPFDRATGMPLRVALAPGDAELCWVPGPPGAGVYMGRYPVRPLELERLRQASMGEYMDPEVGRLLVDQAGTFDWPAAWMTLEAAGALAERLGARLPREAEWDRAARGDDGRDLPWGEGEPHLGRVPERCLRYPVGEWEDFPALVGTCPEGASPFGLEELVGNVFEWCTHPEGPVDDEDHPEVVLRGGFTAGPVPFSLSLRSLWDPEEGTALTGFRLAWSPAEALGAAP